MHTHQITHDIWNVINFLGAKNVNERTKYKPTWQVSLSQQRPVAHVALERNIQVVELQHRLSQSYNSNRR